MTVPVWWFNEVGGFTAYLLVLLGAMYVTAYTLFLYDCIKHWRNKQ